MRYAYVIIPQRIQSALYWRIPTAWNVEVGMLVEVELKRKKVFGIVSSIVSDVSSTRSVKDLVAYHADTELFISKVQLRFWNWLAAYYMCTLGEVMQCAVPSFVYPSTPTYKLQNALNDINLSVYSKEERELIVLLSQHKRLTASSLKKRTTVSDVDVALQNLLRGGIVIERTIKHRPLDLLVNYKRTTIELPTLTAPQQESFASIQQSYNEQKKTVLLHGVTGSGKTNIYLHFIRDILAQEKQVLMLVPEIQLTNQLVSRIQQHLGDAVVVYHSSLTLRKRLACWLAVKRGLPILVLGTRSAVLLPFSKLGLIICDEEHDRSFKQDTPAPHYHARDAAVMLAYYFKANVLLGSATPSLESYQNTKDKKYDYVFLASRYASTPLPVIHIFDAQSYVGKNKPAVWISPPVKEAITTTVSQGKQVIIFQNRRGYAPYVVCSFCGHLPQCTYCNASITYHNQKQAFSCHYCNRSYQYNECAQCGQSKGLVLKKVGTHRIHEAVQSVFPSMHSAVYDLDTTRYKALAKKVLDEYQSGEISIMVATQMMSKGFDFAGTGLVVLLDFESLLSFSDFRNNERIVQQIEQIGGRAGRRAEQGHVWIQTLSPNHPLFSYITSHDYAQFADNELALREKFNYPPFARMIYVDCKSNNQQRALSSAMQVASSLKKHQLTLNIVQGPVSPSVSRIKGVYTERVILKCSRVYATYVEQKKVLQSLLASPSFKHIRFDINVDPSF